MYIISKFESFSNNANIEEIKDIFQDLVDKWDMLVFSKSPIDTKDIRYLISNEIDDINTYYKHTDIGKHIENIEDVYLIIHCDLSGPNDFYTTLYEFNQDCEDLLKRFQSEFNCELLTAYGNQYLQSKGVGTSRFVFVFRSESKLERLSKKISDILPTYKKLSDNDCKELNSDYEDLRDILMETFDEFDIYKFSDLDFNANYLEHSEDSEYEVWYFTYDWAYKKRRGCEIPNSSNIIDSLVIKNIPYPKNEKLSKVLNNSKNRIENSTGRVLNIDVINYLENISEFNLSLSRY